MPIGEFDGAELHYDVAGSGQPLVLVHGNPDDSSSWDQIVEGFAETFKVVTYDRRGFGRNGPDPESPSVERHVADLAALIEELGLAPAHVVSVSGGAIVGLWLAIRRPELVARVVAHEPGFSSVLLADPDGGAILGELMPAMQTVVSHLVAADYRAASAAFVEGVVAPGRWAELSEDSKERLVRNMPRFQAEMTAPDATHIDLEALARVAAPVLLTSGATTTPLSAGIVERLAAACPNLDRHTFATGHTPHLTEPAEFVSVATRWLTS